MAVKWAIANGNWNAGATWNDGVVPADGDVVYCNGHTITANVNIAIGQGTIRNDANDDLGIVAGGYINNTNANRTMTANFVAVGRVINSSVASGRLTITGNADVTNTFAEIANNSQITTMTGNITYRRTNSSSALFTIGLSSEQSYTINGNIINDGGVNVGFLISGNRAVTFTINGVMSNMSMQASLNTSSALTINGGLVATLFMATLPNFYFTGFIQYSDTTFGNMNFGFKASNLHLSTVTSWRNTTSPSAYSFQIFTDADMAAQNYPQESEVKQGVVYGHNTYTGTYLPDYPQEATVLQGVEYAFGEMVGTMDVSVQVGCVTKEDVREGVPLIGMYEDGQQVVGTIIIPAEEDVREGVHYDNDKIGTLIVQGGGDRLRIADFGYYTNAQSDTYIVDITDADKPKFASAEERILIEMFPTLDLDNIPEMYFDDLFVKYLKYRLIVEYYRTAGINSTFTPSEPTTEIVNYRNVTCEVWLNSANTYLNAWNKKFGLNKPPQKIRL